MTGAWVAALTIKNRRDMNDTWSHAAARTLVQPLVGTWVRPNHLTLLRLVSGVLACLLLGAGGARAELWSGILWLLSAFLDRADGELARIGKMQSKGGHLFDYYTDVVFNSAFFLAAGITICTKPGPAIRSVPRRCSRLRGHARLQPPGGGVRIRGCDRGARLGGRMGISARRCTVSAAAVRVAALACPILLAAAVVTSVIAVIFFAKYRRLIRGASIDHIASDHIASIDEECIEHYAAKGWASVPGFFSDGEVAQISDWVDELSSRPERPGTHMVYHEDKFDDASVRLVQRMENFCPFHPGFEELVNGRLKAAVERILGGPAVLFKDKINLKMPGGAGFEAHQDQQAGWSRYAPLFVTALVCIDPATVENGCLEIADSARFTGLIGEEWKPLTADQMAAFALKPLPCSPGEVIFFDSYVPHASKPNRTDHARRILYLTYNAAAYGDHRELYFAEKRANFPPDIERKPGTEYRFRV